MTSQHSSHVRKCILSPLSDWIDVVASVSGSKFAVLKVSEAEYYRTRHRLLQACDECPEADPLCRKLTLLVEPWLDSETLNKADKKIIIDLLARLRNAQSELSGKKKMSKRTLRLLRLAGVAAVAAAFLMAWQTSETWLNWESMAVVRGLGYRGLRYLRSTGPAARVGVVACVVVVCGAALLRGSRKY